MMGRQRFVILDRDGTIIRERHYLANPAEVELIPGASLGLRRLQALGFGLVVVTNQSGVGRGLFTHDCLDRIHRRLADLLELEGIRLDGIYSCPHVPEHNCHCRKPRPGLVRQAAEELSFDPEESIVIGDKPCDIELGRAIGAATLLVRTGYGAQVEAEGKTAADGIADDLDAAATIIEKQWAVRQARNG